MPEVLSSFGGSRIRSRYPWDAWFALETFRLVRGVDFEVPALSMKNAAHYQARRRGLDVITKREGDDAIVIQVVGRFDWGDGK